MKRFNMFLLLSGAFLSNEATEYGDQGGGGTAEVDPSLALAEGMVQEGDDDDDFTIDITNVDTTIPILEKGKNVLLKVKKMDRKKNKAGTGWNLVAYVTNAEPALTNNGVHIPPGEALISLYFPTQANPLKVNDPDYNPDRWLVKIAEFTDVIFGTDKDTRPAMNKALMAEMKDRCFIAAVDIEQPKGEDGKPDLSRSLQNVIKSMKALS